MSDNKCRAKDPNTCPYHGSKLRLETALQQLAMNPTDASLFEAAYQARKELDEVVKKNNGIWKELDETVSATGIRERVTVITEIEQPVKTTNYNGTPLIGDVITNQHPEAATLAFESDEIIVFDPRYPEYIPETYVTKEHQDFPYDFYKIRVQFDRPLNKEEQQHFMQLLGYSWAKNVNGEPLDTFYNDTPSSLIITADSTKGSRSYIDALDLETDTERYVGEGTPRRVRKENTRLVEAMEQPPRFKLFYK